MLDREPFLKAIFAAPDDDLPRLVFADYLDERVDHAWAELIRVQCELARAGYPDALPDAGTDLERVHALAGRQRVQAAPWAGHTPPPCGVGVLCEAESLALAGPGIAAEHIPRLTERFYRIDRSRSRETGGTGLGLAIVKHIAQVHGGQVEVTSTPGQGSTFRLRFPPAGPGGEQVSDASPSAA